MPDPSPNPFIEAANAGLSPIPVDVTTKRPCISWKRYQEEVADQVQLIEWHRKGWAIGVVCGRISGRLMCIDIEAEFMPRLDMLAERLREQGIYDLFDSWIQGYCESTPRGGLHILVHVEGDGPMDGNRKLASSPSGKTWIETRGEGGYTIVAPSPGYQLIKGGFDAINFAMKDAWWQR